jgi:hypothetical protein
MVTMVRNRLLAGVAAAALAASATIALTAAPAAAHDGSDHPGCFLLHLQIEANSTGDIVHLCI